MGNTFDITKKPLSMEEFKTLISLYQKDKLNFAEVFSTENDGEKIYKEELNYILSYIFDLFEVCGKRNDAKKNTYLNIFNKYFTIEKLENKIYMLDELYNPNLQEFGVEPEYNEQNFNGYTVQENCPSVLREYIVKLHDELEAKKRHQLFKKVLSDFENNNFELVSALEEVEK